MRRRLLRAARPLSLAAAALVLAAAGAAAADISPTYEANAVPWGDGGGTTWAKIGAPAGLAASPDGKRFYVADSGNHRIGVLGPEGRQGFLDMWGGTSPGKGPRQFDRPQGVAVDPWGTVVVADTGNERIQRIASDGTYLGSIDLPGVVAVATDSVGSIYALSRFFNTVVWMTSTGKRIAVWQARPPVAAEPLEAWSHPPTGNTKPRMTVRRAVYTLSGITAGPDGTVIVTGNRRLETSYDCAAVSEQLPKKNPATGNDPTIQHAYAWAFDPANGRLLAATDLTRENRRALGAGAEACWSAWDGNGDAGSLVVGPNGQVVAGVNSNMWEGTLEAGAASPVRFRWYVRNPNPLGKSWGRSVRLALTCRGDLLATSVWSGHVFQYTRKADPLPGCNARPPKPTVALGPPVLAPSGRSVTATVACPGKGCSVVVGLEPARRCKACRALFPKVTPKAVRLPAGGTARLSFPLTRDARTSIRAGKALAVQLAVPKGVSARGGGPVPLTLPTSLTLACSPAAGAVRLRGRASGAPANATVALAITSSDGTQQTVLAKTGAGGSFATEIQAPTSGRWTAAASLDGNAGLSPAVSGPCAATVKVAKPAPSPQPAPAPAPTPAPATPAPAPPAALTLSCMASGDPATGAVALQASGILTPGQAGRSVAISFTSPGQAPKTATAATNADGGYSASAQAAPGPWSVSASFAGDAAAGAATASGACT